MHKAVTSGRHVMGMMVQRKIVPIRSAPLLENLLCSHYM
jgi:hypothetical protein